MSCRKVWLNDTTYEVTGDTFAPTGDVTTNGKAKRECGVVMWEMCEIMSLCNDAKLVYDKVCFFLLKVY